MIYVWKLVLHFILLPFHSPAMNESALPLFSLADCIHEQVEQIESCAFNLSTLAKEYGFPYDPEQFLQTEVKTGLPLIQQYPEDTACFSVVQFVKEWDSEELAFMIVFLPLDVEVSLNELEGMFGEFRILPPYSIGTFPATAARRRTSLGNSYSVSVENNHPIEKETKFKSLTVSFEYPRTD